MKKKEKKVERKVAGWATLDARVLQGRKMEVAERGRVEAENRNGSRREILTGGLYKAERLGGWDSRHQVYGNTFFGSVFFCFFFFFYFFLLLL